MTEMLNRLIGAAPGIAAGALIDGEGGEAELHQGRRDRRVFAAIRAGLMKEQDQRRGVALGRVVVGKDLNAIAGGEGDRLRRNADAGRRRGGQSDHQTKKIAQRRHRSRA